MMGGVVDQVIADVADDESAEHGVDPDRGAQHTADDALEQEPESDRQRDADHRRHDPPGLARGWW